MASALLGVAFGLVSIASDRIGTFFREHRLPLVTGFLFTGGLAGPCVVLVVGYGVFAGNSQLLEWSSATLPVHIHLEPLLSCMVASFRLTNFTDLVARQGFTRLLSRVCPPVYVAFFTLTGASLELSVLPDTWHLALGLFAVRLLGIWLGSQANPDMSGLAVRDLRLPLDVALLYVHRGGSMIPSKGTTKLQLGDRVTLSGPVAGLERVVLRLGG